MPDSACTRRWSSAPLPSRRIRSTSSIALLAAELARVGPDLVEEAAGDLASRARGCLVVDDLGVEAVARGLEVGLLERLAMQARAQRRIELTSRDRLDQAGEGGGAGGGAGTSRARTSTVPSFGCGRTSHQM